MRSGVLFTQEYDLRTRAQENKVKAQELILKYKKEVPEILTRQDKVNIVKDYNNDMDDNTPTKNFELRQFCAENYEALWKTYPYDISAWYSNWYEIWLEARDLGLKITDETYGNWLTFYTEIEYPYFFYSFINNLNRVQRTTEKHLLQEFYWNDLEWRAKILKGELPEIDFQLLNSLTLITYIEKKQQRENLQVAKKQYIEKGEVDPAAFKLKYKTRKLQFKKDDWVEHEEGVGIVIKSDYGFDGEIDTVLFYSGLMVDVSPEELKPCNPLMSKEKSLG